MKHVAGDGVDRLSIRLGMVSFSAALGGFLFGFDWVVIGGAKPFYESYFGIGDRAVLQATAMSAALLGCLGGVVINGCLVDRIGRRPLMMVSAILFLLSSLGTAISLTLGQFIIARWVGGVGIGLASILTPVYIAEIAPASMRGRLVAIYQLAIVIGIVCAQTSNWFLADATGPTWVWRWMFAVEAIPAVTYVLLTFLIPESPRWLISRGRTRQAAEISRRLTGSDPPDEISEPLNPYVSTAYAPTQPVTRLSNDRVNRRALKLGIALVVFQQWCGINVIFNYAEEVFGDVGYSIDAVLGSIVATGVINLVGTIVAVAMADRWGRRSAILSGAAGLAIIHTLIGLCFATGVHGPPVLILVVVAIGTYAVTLAPVTWIIVSEIFAGHQRGRSTSICVFFLWTACVLLTFTFPLFRRTLGEAATFGLYAANCLLGFTFFYKYLPETKGQTLEAIEDLLAT